MGNDPRYSKSKFFDPFPLSSAGDLLKAQIRCVAEELDAFRKQRQKEHPSLTLTQMYNVLGEVAGENVDGRDKPGDDEFKECAHPRGRADQGRGLDPDSEGLA